MSEFLHRVESEIQSRRPFLRGQRILVAVSGGVDSMVLLRVLHSLAPRNRWQISVAHFNHRLRGRASDADERLVRKTAAAMKLRVVAESADVQAFAAKSKLSLEMAARKLRHEFLARIARKQKIKTIALAHHAGDQVELFFLRLLRGAGGEGLAGMKWRSPSPADKTISLVRPLLAFSKDELLEFARQNIIRFRNDATNSSSDFLRNRIRNELLPLLRKDYQPGLDKAVLRLMEIVGAEAEFAGEAAQAWLKKIRGSRGNEAQTAIGNRQSAIGNQSEPPYVGCHEFDELPVAIQRRILQSQLAETGVAPDFGLIESLRQSADCLVSVGPKMSVARDAVGKVTLRAESISQFNEREQAVKLGRAGEATFQNRKFRWRLQPWKPFVLPTKKAGVEVFDADKIGGGIVLRHWRTGDRFQPIGLKSAAKLQDLFVNAKISATLRRELVLAETANGEIFWVEGLRISESFKLTPETKRLLVWSWRAT
jgi:tRNA(Ile)-lysidine synthase